MLPQLRPEADVGGLLLRHLRPQQEDAQTNRYIINALEEASELDPSLPLPLEDYRLLCRLDGREPFIPDTAPQMVEEFPIGYREGRGHAAL